MTYRILDLFSGAGGAAAGYQQAGFEVWGVDLEDQPRFPGRFIRSDVFELNPAWVSTFDAIHASPPCQAHTALKVMPNAKVHVDLIPQTRAMLQASGLPYVIENVVGAPLVDPLMLCGSMFGLGAAGYQLQRHRLFECSFPIRQHECDHDGPVIGVYGGHARCRAAKHGGRGTRDFVGQDKPALAKTAMGIDWMTMDQISQAIPPAYTKFIGAWLLDRLIVG